MILLATTRVTEMISIIRKGRFRRRRKGKGRTDDIDKESYQLPEKENHAIARDAMVSLALTFAYEVR